MQEPSYAAARIAVVDDDTSVLESIARLLRPRGFDTRTYSSAELLLREIAELSPSCVVVDLSLPGMDGLQLQDELSAANCDVPIVFVTGHGDIRSSVRAMRHGAVDFLPKPFAAEDLFDAIGRALEQHRSSRELKAAGALFKERAARLTRRERDVFAAVVEGLINKQIAAKLGIAEKTVKIHRARIMRKMEVRSVAQLARLAERFGVPPGEYTPAPETMHRVAQPPSNR